MASLGILMVASSVATMVSGWVWGWLADRSSRITIVLAGLAAVLLLGAQAGESAATSAVATRMRLAHLDDYAPWGQRQQRQEAAVARAVPPQLPPGIDAAALRSRLDPGATVVLTCGNPAAMEDIRRVCEGQGMRVEREEW